MYKLVEVKDTIRVPPSRLGMELEDALKESLGEKYEGSINPELGVVLNVEEVIETTEGKVFPGDGAVFYPGRFKVLVFQPEEHEVILGEVVDITEFGAFIRLGPIDGLAHVSQVMDDFVSYDKKNRTLLGQASKRVLAVGDVVRARVISISLKEKDKIGLTMRQPRLGALHWFEEEKKYLKKEEKKEQKEEKKVQKEEKVEEPVAAEVPKEKSE